MKKKLFSLLLILVMLLSACSVAQEEFLHQTPGELQNNPAGDTLPSEPEEQTETSGSAALRSILEAAYLLEPGQRLEGRHTLTGTVTRIETAYSDRYENISVVMEIPGCEDMPILCFRLEGKGADRIAVGDTITVTGELINYRGTVEFDAGCILESGSSADPGEEEAVYQAGDDSKEAVALYIHTYGRLPDFYMTKSQAKRTYGWDGGSLDSYAAGYAIGGDTFHNYDGQLPDAPGRRWTECDIDTIGKNARGAKRIVFSNDGLIYYTDDHYETFTLLYGEP